MKKINHEDKNKIKKGGGGGHIFLIYFVKGHSSTGGGGGGLCFYFAPPPPPLFIVWVDIHLFCELFCLFSFSIECIIKANEYMYMRRWETDPPPPPPNWESYSLLIRDFAVCNVTTKEEREQVSHQEERDLCVGSKRHRGICTTSIW